MPRLFFCLLFLFLAFVSPASAETPLRVVASFSLLADMARTIGGGDVVVHSLVGTNQDAHVYRPSPKDVKLLAQADVVIVNGLNFEGWMDRLLASSGFKGVVVTASHGILPLQKGKHGVDPHAWQNPANGRIYVRNIAIAFEKARPSKAEAFRRRASAYDAEIAQLDTLLRKDFAALDKKEKIVITSHDAFGYFGAAYNVVFLAPKGLSHDAEPSASNVAKLIAQIKERKVKIVFLENMSNPKLIHRIATETGAQLGGALYADALSEEHQDAPTYLALLRYNAKKIKAALDLTKE